MQTRCDAVFVCLTGLCRRSDPLPNARVITTRLQTIAGSPPVPIADHRHRGGIRCPNGEAGARSSTGGELATELGIEVAVCAFAKEVDIVRGQHGNGLSWRDMWGISLLRAAAGA